MLLRLILAVLWTAFIFYALLSEPSEVPKYWWLTLPGVDKIIHAVLFGIEAALIQWSSAGRGWKHSMPLNLACCILLGGGLEWLQYRFVEGRSGDVLDLLADAFGAALVLLVWRKLFRK
jgi:VanZ family protein